MPEPDESDDLGFQRRLAELETARARARRILDVPEAADEPSPAATIPTAPPTTPTPASASFSSAPPMTSSRTDG